MLFQQLCRQSSSPDHRGQTKTRPRQIDKILIYPDKIKWDSVRFLFGHGKAKKFYLVYYKEVMPVLKSFGMVCAIYLGSVRKQAASKAKSECR